MRVGHFAAQPHCFAYGGFDIQMNRVIDLMNEAGVPTLRVNPWDRSCRFDIAHFWGGEESHSLAFRFCRERSIATVFSVLLPNPSSPGSPAMRLRGWARRLLKGPIPYAQADAIIVINEDQAWVAERVLGIRRERIHTVPTIVDDAFFGDSDRSGRDPHGPILCVGTIGSRKNQLRLLHAAATLPNHVVLCGRFDDGEPAYRAAIERELAARPFQFRHVQDVTATRLRELYAQCSVLACISHHETEPASMLEAMICQRSTVVADRPYGHNRKFSGSERCDPESAESIAQALRRALAAPVPDYDSFRAAAHRAEEVVASYRRVYAAVSSVRQGV